MIRAVRSDSVPGVGVSLVCLFLLGAMVLPAAGAPEPQGVTGQAQQILKATGVQGGLVVHLGCGEGQLTAALRADDRYVVHGLESDPSKVEAARRYLQAANLLGPVSVDAFSGKRLPLIDNFVNLLVAEDLGGVSMEEVLRVLAPNGTAYIRTGGQWTKTVKPRPKEIDEWTHYLHDPTGNAVAHDTAIQPLSRMQWIGGPRYSRHHDHMSAISAMVSAQGRNFYIFDESPRASILIPPEWYLTARDAFNGTVLWKRPIATWHTHLWPLKSGPQLMTRRLVASGDRVYVTLGIDEPLSVLDAATGKTLRTYAETKATEEILYDNGVLLLSVAAEGQPLRSDPKKVYATVADVKAGVSDPLWTEAPRTLMAVEAESGKVLWKKQAPVVSMSLTADSQRVLFYDGSKIQCLDRGTGQVRWSSDAIPRRDMRSSGGVTIVIYGDVVLYSGLASDEKKEHSAVFALSAADGKTLWKAGHPPCGHAGTPDDILVTGGLVWWGAVAGGADSGIMTGRDLHTGEVKKEFPPDVQTHWFHHRCYRAKATDNYLLFSRTGIEFIDVDSNHWTPHHWVRGGCLYGIMPCNGLVYNPPHPCACYLEAKLYGFNALAPASKSCPPLGEVPDAGRLERGPAWEERGQGTGGEGRGQGTGDREQGKKKDQPRLGSSNSQSPIPNPDEWPTFRHDAARSGATPAAVPVDLSQLWETKLGGKLSSVTIGAGKVLVSSIEAHTIHALDAASGKPVWNYVAGARVDSPPTIWQGRVLFGCNDGYVYCLRAAGGQLAWRFRAAPEERKLMAYEQVESVWPVPGSVLVKEGVAWCVAGRSMFLDGGLRLLRLDAATGKKLSEAIYDDRDPESGKNLQVQVQSLNMPVALPDILSADEHYVYLRSVPLDPNGQRKTVSYVSLKDQVPQPDDRHLFSPTGLLDDTMWHRTYWVYGRAFASGAGGYYQAGRVVPAGRLLVFDDDMVYGYGRLAQYYRWSTPYTYHLYAAKKCAEVVQDGAEQRKVRAKTGKSKGTSKAAPVTRTAWQWSDEAPIQVNAMALTGKTLFVAGSPDVLDEEQAAKAISDPEVLRRMAQQEAGFEGRQGALLAAVSAADGKQLCAYRLDELPTFDGMAAAQGKLFLSTRDGKILCLGSGSGRRLATAEAVTLNARPPEADRPKQPAAESATPAKPGRAKKAAKPAKAEAAPKPPTKAHPDFQYLEAVNIVPAKLGYHITATGKEYALALKQLDKPLSGVATFRMKMQLTTEAGRLLTGFLAFGDGASEEQLVKCGLRARMKKAMILQGKAAKSDSAVASFAPEPGQVIDVEVTVDVAQQKVKMTLGGATVEAPLERPMKSVTHVGYCVLNAATDFSPIEIQGQ